MAETATHVEVTMLRDTRHADYGVLHTGQHVTVARDVAAGWLRIGLAREGRHRVEGEPPPDYLREEAEAYIPPNQAEAIQRHVEYLMRTQARSEARQAEFGTLGGTPAAPAGAAAAPEPVNAPEADTETRSRRR